MNTVWSTHGARFAEDKKLECIAEKEQKMQRKAIYKKRPEMTEARMNVFSVEAKILLTPSNGDIVVLL